LRYCTKCLMPDTKPYITFNTEGVCGACQANVRKQQAIDGINWKAREENFNEVILNAKEKKAPFYDVLVPVSGGKDSITQVHRLKNFDVRILAVNVDYGIKTEIGTYNLECIPANLGASLAIYRPELFLHKKLIRIGFEDFGDPDLLSHTMLHAYPLHVALKFEIPLVLLGENSAFEYGGEDRLSELKGITRDWFSKYAANQGHDAMYVSQKYGIPMGRLRFYDFPDELENSTSTQTIFSSYYFCWDSEEHLKIAKSYGFCALEGPREGTYRNYVGIDEKINRIHQYFKVLKFGYGRATDHACEDIRNGRLTREEGKDLVRKHDLEPLSDYYVQDFIDFVGITMEQFHEVLEKFRNRDIWRQGPDGRWYIAGHLEDQS
jgi:N-acetyl sugar amidotransferase